MSLCVNRFSIPQANSSNSQKVGFSASPKDELMTKLIKDYFHRAVNEARKKETISPNLRAYLNKLHKEFEEAKLK